MEKKMEGGVNGNGKENVNGNMEMGIKWKRKRERKCGTVKGKENVIYANSSFYFPLLPCFFSFSFLFLCVYVSFFFCLHSFLPLFHNIIILFSFSSFFIIFFHCLLYVFSFISFLQSFFLPLCLASFPSFFIYILCLIQ